MDVIKFSQNKALECSRDNNLLDRDSARLLWDFIMLLCRQNGVRHRIETRNVTSAYLPETIFSLSHSLS